MRWFVRFSFLYSLLLKNISFGWSFSCLIIPSLIFFVIQGFFIGLCYFYFCTGKLELKRSVIIEKKQEKSNRAESEMRVVFQSSLQTFFLNLEIFLFGNFFITIFVKCLRFHIMSDCEN